MTARRGSNDNDSLKKTDGKTRRVFLSQSALLMGGASLLGGCSTLMGGSAPAYARIRSCGPASKHTPTIKAAFVRRAGEYGMRWPGQVYDGQAAQARYTESIQAAARKLNITLDLQETALHSLEESNAWIQAAQEEQVDGLVVLLLDRQEHAWPTVNAASKSGIPTIAFSPLGSSFTTNTINLAERPGLVMYSTDDFSQAAYGMKMLAARSKMLRTRCVALRGNQHGESAIAGVGITMRNVPARTFLDKYNAMGESPEMIALANEYYANARKRWGASRQDALNGVKSYFVASEILAAEEGDAITMDCLGALGQTKVSLPCIAWSRMNDDGIPAACEADPGAVASHVIVQSLFDRPGFQQDPVADTKHCSLIGAHCSCPTLLNGYGQKPEPYDLIHHHGMRDAVPRTLWEVGKRVTCLDVLPAGGDNPRATLLISTGTVTDNIDVPPSGGCVVSVRVTFDGDQNVLSFPGFHQLFFYGDYGSQLREFGQLCGMDSQVI